MNVNYENAMNAFKMAQEIKKRYKAISMMAYGNLTVMFPEDVYKRQIFHI